MSILRASWRSSPSETSRRRDNGRGVGVPTPTRTPSSKARNPPGIGVPSDNAVLDWAASLTPVIDLVRSSLDQRGTQTAGTWHLSDIMRR